MCSVTTLYLQLLQGIWAGVIHHVTDEHQWMFNYGSGSNSCSHGSLAEERDTEWLKKGSKAHQALMKIVLDRRLKNNVSYFLNFRYVHSSTYAELNILLLSLNL